MRHVITLFDLTSDEIRRIFAITSQLKAKSSEGDRPPLLAGRVMALLFEKPSLRTRVSFETAMIQLGGGSLFLGADVGWRKRESIADFSRVLSRYIDVLVCRAHDHRRVEELGRHGSCPVINGLTNLAHPCQALADLFTLSEINGPLEGQTLAYVGDANNVAHSLAVACGKLDVAMTLAAPEGYHFSQTFLDRLRQQAPNLSLRQTTDAFEAVRGASAVYTDVWTSMGQEAEAALRARDLADYQVNARLMAHASSNACFLHCLPARRGQEVTDDVIDGTQSRVLQQAENRMHLQKGLLVWLLDAETRS